MSNSLKDTSDNYFYEIVNGWSRDQQLKYINDLEKHDLIELVIDHLNLVFSDCETKQQVEEKMNKEYFKNPLTYNKGK